MAKRERGFRRALRKAAKGFGGGIVGMLAVKEATTRPHEFAAKKIGMKLKSYGSKPSLKGNFRSRKQVFNPRTKKWVKFDTGTGRIVSSKSDHRPYKRTRT